jgi:hypothetical protein
MKKLILLLLVVFASQVTAEEARVPDDMAANSAARKACTDAMNADPDFAQAIIATVDKQADQKIIDAEVFAARRIQRNEKHVVYAYAAMWLVAALFVAFLWMRLVSLKSEIAQLRRDLDEAAKEAK